MSLLIAHIVVPTNINPNLQLVLRCRTLTDTAADEIFSELVFDSKCSKQEIFMTGNICYMRYFEEIFTWQQNTGGTRPLLS